jgi:hypothetical protein
MAKCLFNPKKECLCSLSELAITAEECRSLAEVEAEAKFRALVLQGIIQSSEILNTMFKQLTDQKAQIIALAENEAMVIGTNLSPTLCPYYNPKNTPHRYTG